MFSLLLVTAMSAVADMPNTAPTAKAPAANRAYFPTNRYAAQQAYSMPRGFQGGSCGCQYCPGDDAALFFPCAPAAPCPVSWFPSAPRGPMMRVYSYPAPTPCRICPPGGRLPAPCQ